ncbi:MAG: desulfoferrodoxin family protein [Oscillospiraceae bacterium]
MAKFYVCKHCGNLVGIINASGAPLTCCGEHMKELIPNTTEAATEKHLPVVAVDGDLVTVAVGSVAHPMLPEHHIVWVYLETEQGGQRKNLEVGADPVAAFALTDGDKPIAAYAYCNLHGLWKTEL